MELNPKQNAVMSIIDQAYPDGMIKRYCENDSARGDTLAQFIVREVSACTEGMKTNTAITEEAVRCLKVAVRELNAVINALENR
jgi:hypothetical protein